MLLETYARGLQKSVRMHGAGEASRDTEPGCQMRQSTCSSGSSYSFKGLWMNRSCPLSFAAANSAAPYCKGLPVKQELFQGAAAPHANGAAARSRRSL